LAQPARKRGGLDGEDFLTHGAAISSRGRDKGMSGDLAEEAIATTRNGAQRDTDLAELRTGFIIAKRGAFQTLVGESLKIDIRHDSPGLETEAFGLAKENSIFSN
jgi:hypothetical protein